MAAGGTTLPNDVAEARAEAEHRLQAEALDMLHAWIARDWGDDSALNFARFCRRLADELGRLPHSSQPV